MPILRHQAIIWWAVCCLHTPKAGLNLVLPRTEDPRLLFPCLSGQSWELEQAGSPGTGWEGQEHSLTHRERGMWAQPELQLLDVQGQGVSCTSHQGLLQEPSSLSSAGTGNAAAVPASLVAQEGKVTANWTKQISSCKDQAALNPPALWSSTAVMLVLSLWY